MSNIGVEALSRIFAFDQVHEPMFKMFDSHAMLLALRNARIAFEHGEVEIAEYDHMRSAAVDAFNRLSPKNQSRVLEDMSDLNAEFFGAVYQAGQGDMFVELAGEQLAEIKAAKREEIRSRAAGGLSWSSYSPQLAGA